MSDFYRTNYDMPKQLCVQHGYFVGQVDHCPKCKQPPIDYFSPVNTMGLSEERYAALMRMLDERIELEKRPKAHSTQDTSDIMGQNGRVGTKGVVR